MTKKHFIALADAIKDKNVPIPILEALADFCQQQNPRFNRNRWYGYIRGSNGPNGGAIKNKQPKTIFDQD